MFIVTSDRSSTAYRKALSAVWYTGDGGRVKGQDVMELRDLALAVTRPLKEDVIETASRVITKTIATITRAEKELFDSQVNDAASFAESRFKAPNPDGTIDNAYGHLLWQQRSIRGKWSDDSDTRLASDDPDFSMRMSLGTETPWQWAGRELANGKDAFVRFSLPEHQWHNNPSPVDIMHMTFQIRNGKLHATTVTQGCDLIHALPFDLSFLTFCMAKMRTDLHDNGIKLSVGTYTHFMHSAYIAKSNDDLVSEMVGPLPKNHVDMFYDNPHAP